MPSLASLGRERPGLRVAHLVHSWRILVFSACCTNVSVPRAPPHELWANGMVRVWGVLSTFVCQAVARVFLSSVAVASRLASVRGGAAFRQREVSVTALSSVCTGLP